jgi:HSP20 family protein
LRRELTRLVEHQCTSIGRGGQQYMAPRLRATFDFGDMSDLAGDEVVLRRCIGTVRGDRVMATRKGSRINEGDSQRNPGSARSASAPNAQRSGAQPSNASPGVRPGQKTPGPVGDTANRDQATRETTDRERNLQTSREGGTADQTGARPAGTPQRAGYRSPVYGGRGSPFAMMRRMMEDMDRLFADFGVTQPGLLASSFFGPDAGSGTESRDTSRGLLGGREEPGRSVASRPGASLPSTFWAPQVEVFERGSNLVIRADLPGLKREDVNVEVEDDAVVIRGERHNDFEDQREGFYRSERSYGSFYRVIPLPEGVDESKVNATFSNGVLEVTLPRPEERRPASRRVEIR